MNKIFKEAMLLAAATMATFSVSAQTEELWLDKYETQYVIDTVAADSMDVAKNATYNAKLRDKCFQQYAGRYLEEIALLDQLIAAEENEQSLDPISTENRKLYAELGKFAYREGVTKKDLKTIQKYKVPKGFSEKLLKPAKSTLQEKIDQFEPPAEEKRYDWRRRGGGGDVPKKEIQTHKRVPNPECRDNYFNGQIRPDSYDSDSEYRQHKWDKAQQSKGWEWADIDKMESKSISYPEKLSWFEHPNHPEYRFKWRYDYTGLLNAYNESGQLVRVGNILNGWILNDMQKKVMTAICKRDFLANKYDINNAGENTLNALCSRLGVEKTDKQKKTEAAMGKGLSDAVAKGEAARLEKKQAVTKKEYEKAAKKERDAVNAGAVSMLSALALALDEKADNYIAQLKSDHSNDLKYLYKIERIDNTTFKVYYLNDKFECGCIALMKWYNKAPYDAEYEIELLPCETITIRR